MTEIEYDQYAIVCDFDGTISTQDSNDQLFKLLGNAENLRIEELYIESLIGTKEGFIRHFEALKLSEGTYNKFIKENIKIDKDFKAFYHKVVERGMPLIIVSGGFINAISLLLNKENIEGLTVYANELITSNGSIKAKFTYENSSCKSSFGACGNCKLHHMNSIRKGNKKIIFIGDGLTDRCAASEADIVFAKKDLAKYCDENGIKYIKYNRFKDIIKEIFV